MQLSELRVDSKAEERYEATGQQQRKLTHWGGRWEPTCSPAASAPPVDAHAPSSPAGPTIPP
eukprot:1263870-Pyramimonas_sp.AAC.1